MTVIKHVLPCRVRIVFDKKLTRHQFDLMSSAFYFVYPTIHLKHSNGLQGCILLSDSDEKLRLKELFQWFKNYLHGQEALGPVRSPTKADLFLVDTKKISAQVMIVLAFLGWILPVMPGTPFFLIAWSLGWRPKGSKH